MAKHTWTYEEITNEAEARIKHLMALATEKRSTQETSSALSIEDYAYGVYMFWNGLTVVTQEPDDVQRLEAMTTRPVVNHG
jgi:hypothetical protein